MIYLDGAYRVHRPEDQDRFTDLAAHAFPSFAGRITCFGADWLGRQFAIDQARVIAGREQVLMLEMGTGKALEIPVDMQTFHEHELVEEADAVAAYSFFRQWLAVGGSRPSYDQCVAYKQPLFLGGADEVTNLEIADLAVSWSITADLLARVRGLQIGTKIGKVTLTDNGS